ncbi:MAG: family 5 olfactory receptor [Desulfurococcaceae archaeon]|nr:family 5 olfactory receptor [Desulfurococcaceae archaeon]MCC6056988.1 family 5 olfactory receptor [Desulfurococcaceae archaeon]
MDSEQLLRLRYAIVMPMLPPLSGALNTEDVEEINVG